MALPLWQRPYRPAALWLAVVTGVSVLPSMQLPKFDLFSIDKIGHALAYGVLCFLLLWSHARSGSAVRADWSAFLFAVAWGILMEFVQFAFIPGRFYEYDDMLANGVGALLGWWLARTVIKV